MKALSRRTKVVATIGPASSSPEVLKQMVQAGMNVARLNFSHGSYDNHAQVVGRLRAVSAELDTPITLLQDLQGPKIRIGQVPDGAISLTAGDSLTLVPMETDIDRANTVAIDYPHLAEEATPGTQILLDDGLLELRVEETQQSAVRCQVIQGGVLKSRKGVNLPSLDLRLPSMTDKDKADLEFGLSQGVDLISLSFVRRAQDIQDLKSLLQQKGAADMPVVAKIEKPQAIDNLESILDICDGVMVARGDLGVEMNPEKVPRLQKRIIRLCNQRCIPVITATQMLESMIHNPRPTRAEASDVANAIFDGTDAVMLSGESAVGNFPIQSVAMLARIAEDVEQDLQYTNNPPARTDELHALTEALNTIDKILSPQCVVTFTSTGEAAVIAAGERLDAPIVAFTPNIKTYHRLNLVWGVKPLFLETPELTLEGLLNQMMVQLKARQLAAPNDRVLVLGSSLAEGEPETNLLKIHTLR